ncbi:MAG: hypothetical protein IJN43_13760 [Ruminococcus sp.]|nr:hypothetical protein [Ruminococcus sp.]
MIPFANKEKELEYELGRFKKAVTVRDQLIEDMKADMAGMQQVNDMLAAYIVILTKGRERKVKKKELQRIMADASSYVVEPKLDEENGCYILKAVRRTKEKVEG